MKSATLLSGEKSEPPECKARQSENAKKIARLLKKRRELLEKEKLKLESEEKLKIQEKEKAAKKEVKDLNQRSEPTSEEYDDDEPETITENSDSYDSNDEFRVNVISKDLDKGWKTLTKHKKHACYKSFKRKLIFSSRPGLENFLGQLVSLNFWTTTDFNCNAPKHLSVTCFIWCRISQVDLNLPFLHACLAISGSIRF